MTPLNIGEDLQCLSERTFCPKMPQSFVEEVCCLLSVWSLLWHYSLNPGAKLFVWANAHTTLELPYGYGFLWTGILLNFGYLEIVKKNLKWTSTMKGLGVTFLGSILISWVTTKLPDILKRLIFLIKINCCKSFRYPLSGSLQGSDFVLYNLNMM